MDRVKHEETMNDDTLPQLVERHASTTREFEPELDGWVDLFTFSIPLFHSRSLAYSYRLRTIPEQDSIIKTEDMSPDPCLVTSRQGWTIPKMHITAATCPHKRPPSTKPRGP